MTTFALPFPSAEMFAKHVLVDLVRIQCAWAAFRRRGFAGQGLNPRFCHTFTDEDMMSYLKHHSIDLVDTEYAAEDLLEKPGARSESVARCVWLGFRCELYAGKFQRP